LYETLTFVYRINHRYVPSELKLGNPAIEPFSPVELEEHVNNRQCYLHLKELLKKGRRAQDMGRKLIEQVRSESLMNQSHRVHTD